jgi:long-chain acyl-CoA synthetase
MNVGQTVGRFEGQALGASTFRSLPDLWHHRVGSTPNSVAMYERTRDGQFRTIRWSEAARRVRDITNGLLAIGIGPETRCAILARTCPAWLFADIAINCAGAITAALHVRSTKEEVGYVLRDCQAQVVFCGTPEDVKQLGDPASIPELQHIVVFQGQAPGAMSLAELSARGRAHGNVNPTAYQSAHALLTPQHTATILYTSGTTGLPKGVMTTHDAWIYQAEAIEALDVMTPADLQVLFLPMSHVFAKAMAAVFLRIGIPTLLDGDAQRLRSNLAELKPTWFAAVPLVLDEIRSRALEVVEQMNPIQRKMADWAFDIARRISDLELDNQTVPHHLRLQRAAIDRVVMAPLRARLGGQLRFIVCGGAPLAEDTCRFFHALGIPVLEGYGMTESGGAACVNRPDHARPGTVGAPLPGTEIHLAHDGEIQIRNRGVFLGYHGHPEDTAEVLLEGGWLRTGDLGHLHDDGTLVITGRKKNLLVTSAGKNVAPAPIELKLKSLWPYIEHVVVVGHGRPYLAAILILDMERVESWAKVRSIAWVNEAELASHPRVIALIQEGVDRANQTLAPWERIRRFSLLAEPFSVDNGLLTATGKVRRQAVVARHAHHVSDLYDQKSPAPVAVWPE